MRNRAEVDSAAFDSPDPDQVYLNYLDSCQRKGIEPVPRNRARELIKEWADALTGSRSDSPPSH
jgi:hypothetical protein